jgi:inner membrane protein
MEARAREVFAAKGIEPEQVLAIAGPFNTVMWKVIALEDAAYHNVYLSLLDGPDPVPVYTHPRRPDLSACVAGSDAYAKLAWFSRGFLKAEERDGRLVVSDLRMGMTPDYVFQFALADLRDGAAAGIPAERDLSHRRMGDGDGGWLWARITGRPADRLAEMTGAPLQPAGPLICQAAPAAGTPG